MHFFHLFFDIVSTMPHGKRGAQHTGPLLDEGRFGRGRGEESTASDVMEKVPSLATLKPLGHPA